MKSLFLIIIIICTLKQELKKVYILTDENNSSLIYDEDLKNVNLYIDDTLIKDEKLQLGVKLYLASFFVNNRNKLSIDFIKLFKCSLIEFGRKHKELISDVIYYLENQNHGNLPLVYHSDAYLLLEIDELKPNITVIKEKLEKSDMLLIEVDGNIKPKQLKWIKIK